MPLVGILRQTEQCFDRPRAKIMYFVSAYYDGLGPRRMNFKITKMTFSTHLGMIHLRLIPISEWKHCLVVTEIMAYKYTQKQNKLINTM